MNIHPFFMTFIELLIVLTFFVFPSFSSKHQSFISFSNMIIAIIFSIFSTLCILLLHKKRNFWMYIHTKSTISLKKILFGISTLLLLIASSFLFSLFAKGKVIITIEHVSHWHHYGIILIWIFFLSLFEESLYRFYIPDTILQLLMFFPQKKQAAVHHFFYYGIPILLFSFAHYYNGVYGIIFAGFSCIFFFLLKNKYNSLMLNSLVHCAYNVISIYLIQKTI
jgi:hypothetical protein